MCRDKGAKFKLYDVNKGGSIDLEELELALEEYFNSVRIRPCIYTTM
jgi:Ca2+-binding EF-hand superfamily protein